MSSCLSHKGGGQTAFKEDRVLLTEGPLGAKASEESGFEVMADINWQQNLKLGIWRGRERNW